VSLENLMMDLYKSEITFSVSSDCYDGGFTVKVQCNDFYGETWGRIEHGIMTTEEVEDYLVKTVIELYPNSMFTKKRTQRKPGALCNLCKKGYIIWDRNDLIGKAMLICPECGPLEILED